MKTQVEHEALVNELTLNNSPEDLLMITMYLLKNIAQIKKCKMSQLLLVLQRKVEMIEQKDELENG